MEENKRQGSSLTGDSSGGVPLDLIPLHSTDLLTVLTEAGVILYESPSIERIFGYDQDDLVGEQVAEYFHPDDRDQVFGAFQAVVGSEEYQVQSVEYRHKQADGSYRWVESVASAHPTPEGNYVVNTRAISKRKAREQELKSSNSRLDAFAGVVSHDLKNPLTVAQGRLQLAQADGDNEHLESIGRALDRMETLIEDLLMLARSGTQVQELERVDLAGLCRDCWAVVTTDSTHLLVELDCHVQADPSRLRQLLENLFRNAVEQRAAHVTVGELDDRAGFFIADDGPGVDEDDRDQVFDSGFSTRETGTGLGLSIVKEIAEAHGWQITLTESSSGGAKFDISGVECFD